MFAVAMALLSGRLFPLPPLLMLCGCVCGGPSQRISFGGLKVTDAAELRFAALHDSHIADFLQLRYNLSNPRHLRGETWPKPHKELSGEMLGVIFPS